ncbi:hypothetical protein Ciccas_003690 [Cichlidogyrus casuarinus]|uniref:Uncharacterized protein n=1 Tax=Cichlidogyrus casuarinus TaxID=1844966 RepID=A0ABD2QDN8_9PLAT
MQVPRQTESGVAFHQEVFTHPSWLQGSTPNLYASTDTYLQDGASLTSTNVLGKEETSSDSDSSSFETRDPSKPRSSNGVRRTKKPRIRPQKPLKHAMEDPIETYDLHSELLARSTPLRRHPSDGSLLSKSIVSGA